VEGEVCFLGEGFLPFRKKTESKLGNDLKELEKSLTYMTLANVEAMKKKENIEVELDKLQDYVLSLQQEGFNQVV